MITAVVSATDTAIQKKFFELGKTTLIISNEEVNDIMDIKKCLKGSGLLMKGVSETIKDDIKNQNGGFLVCY